MVRYKPIHTGAPEANLKALAETSVQAHILDNGYRKRDERYTDQAIHTTKPDPLWNKAKTPGTGAAIYTAELPPDGGSHALHLPR